MIVQSVNLYREDTSSAFEPLAARNLLAGAAVVLVLLALAGAFRWWGVHSLRDRANLTAEAQELREGEVAALEQQFPKPKRSRLLEAEVKRLQRELRQKQRLADALAGGSFGNADGFSRHLEGLARQHVEGTWLTRVSLANGGRAMALGGRALAPSLVPAYVQRLGGEPVFAGRAFSNLLIRADRERPDAVEFALRTPGTSALAVEAQE